MTPSIDRFLNQFKRYKIALVVFLTLNVFSVTCALVLGTNYFLTKKDLGQRQAASLEKISQADHALVALEQLQYELRGRTKIEIKNADDERKVLTQLALWQELRTQVDKILPQPLNLQSAVLLFNSENINIISQIKLSLISVKEAELKTMSAQLSSYNDSTRLMILIGSITLVFGIILPFLTIYLMGRALNHVRREMQNSVLEFVRSWTEAKAGFGDEAFKNVEFWLQILLIVGQITARMSSHPAAIITSEVVYLIRLELQKKARESSAA